MSEFDDKQLIVEQKEDVREPQSSEEKPETAIEETEKPEEEPKAAERPTLKGKKGIKNVLKQIVPWAITAGIFYYIFTTIPINEVKDAIKDADVVPLIVASCSFTLVWYLLDIGSWYLVWNWFNCRISPWEVVKLRGGVLLFQALIAPLAGAAIIFYLNVKKKVPVLEAISSGTFFGFVDGYTFMLFLAPAAFLMEPSSYKPYFMAWAVGAWSYAILHFVFWLGKHDLWKMAWLREIWIVRPFKMAGYDKYLKLAPFRAGIIVFNVVCHYFALKAFNIDIPLTKLIMGLPIIFGTSFLPISVGGMGVPQLLWIEFYSDYASKAQITAFSLVWSTSFLLSRVVIGSIFLRPIWKDVFSKQGEEVIEEPTSTA